ncbi:PIN domain-containing protein [Gloeobacter morelensis]|uniref:PIN domain-containing protein n=1 Tax=Gloeobacter morelensis MG652769 TaxID=2781736 RepID=A0ABY3PSK0_9CYAN|nr:PIN domain-containing protein [Gloeobacter morelensis]UFP96468.1 PIN domain-containing protein [Gloeobacter morelensis MG652769]
MSGTKQPQFVDTNILIYAHDRSAGQKYERARALVEQLWDNGNGCLSIQVLQEFYINMTRKVTHPLAPQPTARIIADLSSWSVHRPGVEDILQAIDLQERFAISFWDAMILASAQQLQCEVLWSEDLNTGQLYGQTRVCNPF